MAGNGWRRIALGALVSGGFLFLAFRNVSLAELRSSLAHLDATWLLPAVGLSLLIMILRTWRWQLELRPLERVPFGRLWLVTAVAYLAINLFPFRLGEVVRPWLLSRRTRLSMSNAVGSVVVEKTFDSLAILFYVLVGLLTVGELPDWVRPLAIVPAALTALLVIVVLLLYWRGEAFVDKWILSRLPERVRLVVRRIVLGIVSGMRIIPNPALLLSVFLVSLLLWFVPILSSYVMIRAFDFDVPFRAALVVFIFIGFGTALPNLPAMVGPYQYACQLALEMFGVSKADGLAYGLVLNAVQFLTIIAQGAIALPFAGASWSDLRRAREEVASAP